MWITWSVSLHFTTFKRNISPSSVNPVSFLSSWSPQKRLSPLLFLTPRLPGFLIGRRLNSHGRELLLLDRALGQLGLDQLDDSEVRQVTCQAHLVLVSPVVEQRVATFSLLHSFTPHSLTHWLVLSHSSFVTLWSSVFRPVS